MCFPLGFYWRPKESKLLNKCGLLGNLALVLKKFSCGETGNFNTWPMAMKTIHSGFVCEDFG